MFKTCLNVEPFFNSPFGLDRTRKKAPVEGVSLMLHKLMAGELLDDIQPTIRVLLDPLSPKGGCVFYTEQGFLEFLQRDGRAFPCTPGVRPKGVVLLAGRRAGKTSLLRDKALYDAAMTLSASNFDTVVPGKRSADYLYSTFNSSLGGIVRKTLDAEAQNTWLGTKVSTLTNSSIYFEDRDTQNRVRVLIRTPQARGVRGGQYFGWYADEFAYQKNFGELFGTVMPGLMPSGNQYVLVSSPNYSDPHVATNYFNYAKSHDDYLALAIHTWEMHPDLPQSVYVSANDHSGNLNEFLAYPDGVR